MYINANLSASQLRLFGNEASKDFSDTGLSVFQRAITVEGETAEVTEPQATIDKTSTAEAASWFGQSEAYREAADSSRRSETASTAPVIDEPMPEIAAETVVADTVVTETLAALDEEPFATIIPPAAEPVTEPAPAPAPQAPAAASTPAATTTTSGSGGGGLLGWLFGR
ncbi:hypothetical protein Q4511_09960 [Paracoccus sp. 1_MG-2023]|uniref:hypothetical protein n=1 Tax=unclassified Paracoccus (in: a-proteobacteria) TaxID=2688777 RepID=UPI001C0A239C|nr:MULTISPECIES: hypothetical protein [unclassified Paracoccus (in: a-proteobacteria)]MBU2956712.1 hypothetical protein [Paracoccus sp. C2R09]MDO6669248.1 hypothetical protein [Paracoccus sp. 1_MG-2023]